MEYSLSNYYYFHKKTARLLTELRNGGGLNCKCLGEVNNMNLCFKISDKGKFKQSTMTLHKNHWVVSFFKYFVGPWKVKRNVSLSLLCLLLLC